MKCDVLEIGLAYEDRLVRVELFGDEVEAIRYVDPTTGDSSEHGSVQHLSGQALRDPQRPPGFKRFRRFRLNCIASGFFECRGQVAGGSAA